ncbi:MAG: hypothetical protein NW216_05725 [Hyphomicrobium sp.]|nr:hypothetical protein [Hyphomicrobium sp.]
MTSLLTPKRLQILRRIVAVALFGLGAFCLFIAIEAFSGKRWFWELGVATNTVFGTALPFLGLGISRFPNANRTLVAGILLLAWAPISVALVMLILGATSADNIWKVFQSPVLTGWIIVGTVLAGYVHYRSGKWSTAKSDPGQELALRSASSEASAVPDTPGQSAHLSPLDEVGARTRSWVASRGISRGSYLAGLFWLAALVFASIDSGAFTDPGSFDLLGFLTFLLVPTCALFALDWALGRRARSA